MGFFQNPVKGPMLLNLYSTKSIKVVFFFKKNYLLHHHAKNK